MTAPTASRPPTPLTTSVAAAPPPESQDSELAPLAALDADVVKAIEASRSHHTRRALASRWRVFTDWAQSHDVPVLPAAPEDVARYLTALAQRGASVATIRAYASAIATQHRDADLDNNPCAHQGVRLVIKGLSRAHAQPQRQATPLDAAVLEAIRETACVPRPGRGGVLESEAAALARGLVDIALCTLMSDAGLRRSEAAALTWGRRGALAGRQRPRYGAPLQDGPDRRWCSDGRDVDGQCVHSMPSVRARLTTRRPSLGYRGHRSAGALRAPRGRRA